MKDAGLYYARLEMEKRRPIKTVRMFRHAGFMVRLDHVANIFLFAIWRYFNVPLGLLR